MRSPAQRNRLGLVVDARTSERLGRIRQKNTAAELLVRRAAYARGLRFRVRNPDLPGRPDLANRSACWAVFVHGCFWHRHKGCRRATTPKRNRPFWLAKFRANVARDRRVAKELERLGYVVVTIWECEAENERELATKLRALAKKIGQRRKKVRPGG